MTTASVYSARLNRRHQRLLLWPGLVVTILSVLPFLVSVWGVQYTSPPRFPNDPPSPLFPPGFPMRTRVGLWNGLFYFVNRAPGMHGGWVVNTDSLPTGDVRFWPRSGRVVHLNTTPIGSSRFELRLEVPLWPPVLVGCGLLIGYRIMRRPTREQRGLCPRCAYARHGLSAEVSCPECGLVPDAAPQ
jgi:hypothetical protein